MIEKKYSSKTEILYKGADITESNMHPEAPPICPSTAYIMADMDEYDYVNGGNGGYFYSRTANPNRDSLAELISYLENGESSIICSSGMAAISTALLTFSNCGDHIVASSSIYGETIELFNDMLSRFGIEITYVDFCDIEAVKNAVRPNTRILFTEIISNPLISVIDIEKIVDISHQAGSLVIVDSTFTTPLVIKPLDFGVDVVIQSLTKFYNGHSDVTAGSISATSELCKKMYSSQLRLGCCLDPNSSWLALRGIRTMGLRVSRQIENAQLLAEALSNNPQVRKVNYPGLKSHPQHILAARIFTGGYGAMISFCVEDNREKVNAFMHELKLVKYLGTLGGYRTSISHPATAFRLDFTQDELIGMGMSEGLIRISVGIEDITDLIHDFTQALEVFEA
jgi:cystathionine gamma-synthase